MARYPEKRRQALEATMRQEVFRVASGILREAGLKALTMDRIAREVGVSRATLYNYFADSDAVMNFVEARAFEPVAERVADIVANADSAPEKLEAVARTVLGALYEERALLMALFAKQALHGPRAEQKRRHRARILDQVQMVITAGIAEGSLRQVPPRLAADAFMGALGGLIDSMVYADAFRPADEIVPGLMDVLRFGLDRR
jgi:TetR/AcrR family fatty acid metabolism transcriptional regulator